MGTLTQQSRFSIPDTCSSRTPYLPPHPGGVNCLFGDGSARFIKNSINAMTWVQLESIRGGEVLSADEY